MKGLVTPVKAKETMATTKLKVAEEEEIKEIPLKIPVEEEHQKTYKKTTLK